MTAGGSKPKKPSTPAPTASETAQADVAEQKWNDFTERYMPIEAMLRDRVNQLDSPAAYDRAMAQAANNAALQMGRGSMAGLRSLAGGAGGAGLRSALYGANNLATGVGSQYLNQRANFFNQGKSLMEMGAGISAQGMGAFKSVADYDRNAANMAFANKVGRNLADASQTLGTLNAVGQMAMMAAGAPSGSSPSYMFGDAKNWMSNKMGWTSATPGA